VAVGRCIRLDEREALDADSGAGPYL
jgi:hypothetical protein